MNHKIFILLVVLTTLSGPPLGAQETEQDPQQPVLKAFADEPAEERQGPEGLGRKKIVPWSVDVLGKNYENFPNDEASRVLTDWLVASLADLKVFDVVNRDQLEVVLSEQRAAADDVSPSNLASAGQLLAVHYILFGSFKNLGENTEVDFKLLDVNAITYTHSVNFTFPFNPAIEEMKGEIDRVVAALAVQFPVVARISEVLDDRRLLVGAGTESGVRDAFEVELWPVGASAPAGAGYVTRSEAMQAEVELDEGAPPLDPLGRLDYLVRIKIVPPAQAALQKGLRDLERGEYGKAAAVFRKGLEAEPDNGLLHANYARSLWRAGDYENAVDAFRKALGLAPDDVALLEDAAAAMLESGRVEELIETLRQDQRVDRSPALALIFGQAQEVLGYHERAREAYGSVLTSAPDHPEAHFRLAVLAVKERELEEAERELALAREGQGDSLEMELGIAGFDAVRTAPAEGESRLGPLLDRARSARDFAALAVASEMLLLHEPLWTSSLKLARESLGFNPGYLRATMAAARAHAVGAQRAPAASLLDEVLGTHPASVAALLLSGELLTAEVQLAEAESRLRQARDLAGDDWRPSAALGDVYMLRQDYPQAVPAYVEALERAEGRTTAHLTALLYKSGKAAVLARRHETARPYLERCVASAPGHKECRYYAGLCYFEQGSPEADDKAITSFKAAADVADSLYYLGALAERKETFDDALSWYRMCVEAPCAAAEASQTRIDLIESVTGTVTALGGNGKKATLDVGRIHGVTQSQEGFVVQPSQPAGRVRVEEVQSKTSVAVFLRGSPRVGQKVRFRPTRPRGVRVEKADPKGVMVRWQANPEPEVELYEVLQSSSPRGSWKLVKKVRHPARELLDKSAKPGSTYYFKVVAVNEARTRSRDSDVVQIQVR